MSLLEVSRTNLRVLLALLARPLPGTVPRLVSLIRMSLVTVIALIPIIVIPPLLGRPVTTSTLVVRITVASPPVIRLLVLGTSEAFTPSLSLLISLGSISHNVRITVGVFPLRHISETFSHIAHLVRLVICLLWALIFGVPASTDATLNRPNVSPRTGITFLRAAIALVKSA